MLFAIRPLVSVFCKQLLLQAFLACGKFHRAICSGRVRSRIAHVLPGVTLPLKASAASTSSGCAARDWLGCPHSRRLTLFGLALPASGAAGILLSTDCLSLICCSLLLSYYYYYYSRPRLYTSDIWLTFYSNLT